MRKTVEKINEVIQDLNHGTSSLANKTLRDHKSQPVKTIGNFFDDLLMTKESIKEGGKEAFNVSSNISSLNVKLNHSVDALNDCSSGLINDSQSILAATEETFASITEIVGLQKRHDEIIDILVGTNKDLIQNNLDHKDKSDEIAFYAGQMGTKGQEFKTNLDEYFSYLNRINTMVEVVRKLASKIDLLSLNASIEAVRAGDYGNGFLVVANEIKNLSNLTKDELGKMEAINDDLKKETKRNIHLTQDLFGFIKDIQVRLDDMNQDLLRSAGDIHEMTSHVDSISSSSAFISHSVQEVYQATEHITQKSETMVETVDDLNKNIEAVSQVSQTASEVMMTIKDMNSKVGNYLSSGLYRLSNQELVAYLKKAISDHKTWLKKLENIVESSKDQALQLDGNLCAFGQFYNAFEPDSSIRSTWQNIRPLHDKLHKSGGHVKDAIKQGDKHQAGLYLKSCQNLSSEIEKLFQDMIDLLSKG